MKWLLKTGFTLLAIFLIGTVLITLPLKYINPIFWSWQLQREFNPPAGYPAQAQYRWVDLEQIARPMQLAVIAAEDQLFLDHNGIDIASTKQAFADMRSGKRLRGASTLSQQTAKNVYLWSGKSMVRKALEAWLTLFIEWQWGKPRILEIYLNIVEFGPGIYGVEAASRHFYGISASRLNVQQSATLAAVLPNPYLFNAAAPSQYQRQRAQWIQRQMRQLGQAHMDPLHK